jgi:hypothetical protein
LRGSDRTVAPESGGATDAHDLGGSVEHRG